MTTRLGSVPPDHVVAFYDRSADLVTEIAELVAGGLERRERVVLVTTADHLAAVDDVLVQFGVDPVEIRRSGAVVALDAGQLLSAFMTDYGPDPSLFAGAVGPLLDAAAGDGRRVRVYGEMVALLWTEGDVAGAMQVEALWNALASTHDFSLMCGYPTSVLDASLTDAHDVCVAHTQVIAPRSYGKKLASPATETPSDAVSAAEVFLPLTSAVPAARRFVSRTLRSWGEDALVNDGTLIVSELATNAVRHAGSPFRITLQRVAAAVRIAIEDVDAATPRPQMEDLQASGGRGVHIVGELARSWGWDPVTTGKIVWAELATTGPGCP